MKDKEEKPKKARQEIIGKEGKTRTGEQEKKTRKERR